MAQKKTNSKTDKAKTKAASGKENNVKNESSAFNSRPITGIVFAVLGVFSFLGYFNSDGVFIKFFRRLLTGLFGWGFYFIPPAFIAVGVLLLLVKRKQSKLKIAAILLLPVVIGALYQLLFSRMTYKLSFKGIGYLWKDGISTISGGVISGMLTVLFKYLFSAFGAGVLLFAMLFGLLFVCFNKVIIRAIEKQKAKLRLADESRIGIINSENEKPIEKADEVQASAIMKKITGKKRKKCKSDTVDLPVDEINDELDILSSVRMTDDFVVEGIDDKDVPWEFSEKPSKAKKRKRQSKKDELIEEFTAGMEIENGPQTYQFPPIEMLSNDDGSSAGRREPRDEVRMNKERLENALDSFGVNAAVSNIVRGPAVTRYEMELEAGVKLNKLTNLSDDIALSLGVAGVRIAAIPNKISTVGIEVPNRYVSKVYLRDIIDSAEFKQSKSKLTFALGKNIGGDAIVGNIAKLPHLLVAGTTGSGKSVCLNSLILSILYKATPDEVKFIMIDPKMVEFKIYNGIPHLLVPVVTEAKKSAGALQWAVTEMMKRYSIFSDTGARDLESYNRLVANAIDSELKPLPQIVVVIDELADLMLVAAKEVEESICRVAQMGRAAGVHLVIATQSPRADVITGLMKANIPSRISFKVASSLESRIILDAGGSAETLMGNGDMLYAPIGSSKPMRVQGTWVTDDERENILNFIKQSSQAEYSDEVIDQIEKAAEGKQSGGIDDQAEENPFGDCDELYGQAVEAVLDSGQASVSYLQRRLKVGYARAARLVDQMEERGIVGPFEGAKPRQLLIDRQQWQEMQFIHHTAPVEYSKKDVSQSTMTSFFDDLD